MTFLLSALGGFLLPLGYPPQELWWLSLFSFLPFLGALSLAKNRAAAALCGLCFGVAAMGELHFWLLSFMRWTGLWGGVFFLTVLVYQAFIFVLFAFVFYEFKVRLSRSFALILSPLLWTLLEYASTFGTFGLQESLGHSQLDNLWIKKSASLLGVNYLSYLVVAFNSGLLLVIQSQCRSRGRGIAYLMGLTVLILSSGRLSELREKTLMKETRAPIRVALINPSFDASVINNPREWERIYLSYLSETQAALQDGVKLVIWPEFTFPDFEKNGGRWFYPMRDVMKNSDADLFFGSPWREGDALYNAGVLFSDGQYRGAIHKERLFPYGELIPRMSLFWWFRSLMPEKLRSQDLSPGVRVQPVDSRTGRIGATICLESLYTDLVRRRVRDGGEILINLTNDAWFMNSSASERHFFVGAMRALENGRFFLQSALYGVTGIVDPHGNIIRKTGPKRSESVRGVVYPYGGKTWYTKIGLWRFPIFFLLTIIYLLIYYFNGSKKMTRDS